MRMAARFTLRVKAWGAANAVPVDLLHRPASASTASPRNTWPLTRSVPGCFGARRQGPGAGVDGETVGGWSHRQHRKENRVRQSLFVPPHRPGVGACDHQDVGASAVRRADHPQRTRVRGPPSPGGGDSIHQGRQLLHRGRRPRGPGSDRRCLVAGCGCRAAEPGLPTWIYSACLCFALDLDQQRRSGFVYGFSVYQLEYSRNLIFADGASDAADRSTPWWTGPAPGSTCPSSAPSSAPRSVRAAPEDVPE